MMIHIKKHYQSSNKLGFTLIEIILYVAIVSIFISGLVLYSWDVILGSIKSQVQVTVNQELRLVSQRIIYEIRNATAVNSVGSNDLCLGVADASHNPTRIYLSGGVVRIAWGGGTSDCSAMTNDLPFTSDLVVVDSLNFIDRTGPGGLSVNVRFNLQISHSNPSGRSEWERTEQFQSAVEVRSP